MGRENARATKARNSRARTLAIEQAIASGASNTEVMERYGLSYVGLRRIKDAMLHGPKVGRPYRENSA